MVSRVLYTVAVIAVTLLLLWFMALAVVSLAQATIDGVGSLQQWARGKFR